MGITSNVLEKFFTLMLPAQNSDHRLAPIPAHRTGTGIGKQYWEIYGSTGQVLLIKPFPK